MSTKSIGGKRGPAKTPTGILKQRGSWRAKENEKTEPQHEPGIPVAPASLKGYAKRTWNEMVPLLDAAGVLSLVDGKALARYCEAWARWVLLVKDKSPDPAYVRLDKMMKLSEHLLRLEVQYGLTPASRPGVKRLEKPAHGNAKDKSRFKAAV